MTGGPVSAVQESPQYFFPNKMGRIILLAMEEVMGHNGVNAVLNLARLQHRIGSYPDLTFRVLPLGMKLKVGFEVMAQTFNKFTDHLVRLGEDEQYFHWIMERCGTCWGRKCDSPCCHLAVGILEEGLYWVSGGKNFCVEEVLCIAAGDRTCTILIDKRPLD